MLRKLIRMLPEYYRGQIISILRPVKVPEFEQYNETKKIFVFLAGYYQNLGDMALTYSHIHFLKDNFPDYAILVIPSDKTYQYMKYIRGICKKADIITILGGGNMDDIYTSLEDCRRFVIKSFPNNKVVSFPQTMAFSDTPFGIERLKKTVKTYNQHKNMYVFTRERKSLAYMQKYFTNATIGLCPDMVLYLDKSEPQVERTGIVCCLRNDKERSISTETNNCIRNILNKSNKSVEYTDTVNVTPEECKPENIESTLNSFWNKIRSSKVVLTDRLHCMIFCAITKTPCIVFDNSNQKISGVYNEWLGELGYVYMLKEINYERIFKEIDNLYNLDIHSLPKLNLKEKFAPLIKALSED